jgi:membrane-associated protease RseP (regulator of RpoE activity)
MIREVAPNSPAARAKLKVYDILTAYNDQKLFSAEQLSHMVWASNPDKAVKLRLVRSGTAQDIQIKPDAVQVVAEPTYPRMEISMDTGSPAGNRESFDSISLMKLKDGNSRAEIQYFDKDGKLVKQDFTGTPDAIRGQIMKQPGIPATERNQLLQALNARNVVFFPPMPTGWIAPGFFMPSWFGWPPYF